MYLKWISNVLKNCLVLVLFFNILKADDNNIVKTSELELFLFKVGFDSLLKDMKETKDISKLNESEIITINQKIDFIMNEIYKRNIKVVESADSDLIQSNINKEINSLKNEINALKLEILTLKENNKNSLNNSKKSISKIVEGKNFDVYLKYGKVFKKIGEIPNEIFDYKLIKCTTKNLDEEWCKISYNDNNKFSSWISKNSLEKVSVNSFSSEMYKLLNIDKGSILNIRNGVGTSYKIIDSLSYGKENISIKTCISLNNQSWCWISYKNKEENFNQGWVNSKFLLKM